MEIPIGYKFFPTDQELVNHYLRRKCNGKLLPAEDFINERNLYCQEELSQIFETAKPKTELYYFTQLKKKSLKGKRIDRTVGKEATWKALDRGKAILNHEGKLVGRKRSFDYVNEGSTENHAWDMKEYSLDGVSLHDQLKNKDYVLCVIKMKERAQQRRRGEFAQQEQPIDDQLIDDSSDLKQPIFMQDPSFIARGVEFGQQELAIDDQLTDDDSLDLDSF